MWGGTDAWRWKYYAGYVMDRFEMIWSEICNPHQMYVKGVGGNKYHLVGEMAQESAICRPGLLFERR